MNTSPERVTEMMRQSDAIYDQIDQLIEGEARYRRMTRLGVNVTAIALCQGNSVSEAGMRLLGVIDTPRAYTGPLDTLGNEYADVTRATLDRNNQLETDGRHAIHLLKLAVPYAMKYAPSLDIGKVAT